MSYYTRVMGIKNTEIPLEQLRERLRSAGFDAEIESEKEDEGTWSQVSIRHRGGDEVVTIEKNIVAKDELGGAEINKFIEEISDAKPESARKWLANYLPRIQVIYAVQRLARPEDKAGSRAFREILDEIWDTIGGIIHDVDEGFFNEEGYYILWQFRDGSENAKGPMNMAVLDESGGWQTFGMDLGDKQQREDFWAGRVPAGAGEPDVYPTSLFRNPPYVKAAISIATGFLMLSGGSLLYVVASGQFTSLSLAVACLGGCALMLRASWEGFRLIRFRNVIIAADDVGIVITHPGGSRVEYPWCQIGQIRDSPYLQTFELKTKDGKTLFVVDYFMPRFETLKAIVQENVDL